ncbi:unnamed protein product [Vicia faba]|uniref:Uncharacterized protein n=1 Tax=Vicia faba TaxID=3906 RepID=A0AAV0Z6C7_VICFA|nr:unnamed protein product [Vicia faba]
MAASSSTLNSASVASCAPTFKPTNSKDIGWKYNHLKDLNNKKKVTCDLTSSGEISRAKRHQLTIIGDVVSCTKTPEDVKAILRADMIENERIKKGIQEVSVQLDADDTIDIEEIRRIQTGKRMVASETSSRLSRGLRGRWIWCIRRVRTQASMMRVSFHFLGE